MRQMRILLIDGHTSTYRSLKATLPESDYAVTRVRDAESALSLTDDQLPDVIILELALAGHSGAEFLYELRTYRDWMHIPVIVYSRVKVEDEVQKSRTWKKLGIAHTFYKPETTLANVRSAIEKLRTVE